MQFRLLCNCIFYKTSSRENLYLKHRVFKNNTHHIAVYLETGKKKDKFVTFVSLDEAVLLNNLGVPEVN